MKMDKSVQITLIIVVGVVLLALLAQNISNPNQNTISVAGTATVEATPDLIGVYFSVDTKGTTSQEASDKNSEIVNALINSLTLKGFEREDIKTVSFIVYP